ncbi:unnamed protein product [Lupinus luteus]|uniref:RING-type domain-containing protein n=1 Tax=Lupinus luteus TaxID=3873 RepID=A0AAV1X4N9_LUPLU
MAIHASLQHATNDKPPFPDAHPKFEASSSTGRNNTSKHGFVVTDVVPVDGPIQYPSIDLNTIDMSSPVVEKLPKEEKHADGNRSLCVICLDAPAEGACIPCGHVAGCMSCLNKVKTKKLGCPVCRAKINQVIKLYHV